MGRRKPGGESLIMRFLPAEVWLKYDLVVRFDADLSFLATHYLASQAARYWSPTRTVGVRREHRHIIRAVPARYIPCVFRCNRRSGRGTRLGYDRRGACDDCWLSHTQLSPYSGLSSRIPGSARGIWRGQLAAGGAAFAAGYSPAFMLARSPICMRRPGWPAAS
jgi:hypothetical protein